MIDDLGLRNRAYQVLYALGDTAATVRTLTSGEAACLVGIVGDLLDERAHPLLQWTELDELLYHRMSPRMIQYVAEGGI